MTKLIAAFRNFANAPKNYPYSFMPHTHNKQLINHILMYPNLLNAELRIVDWMSLENSD